MQLIQLFENSVLTNDASDFLADEEEVYDGKFVRFYPNYPERCFPYHDSIMKSLLDNGLDMSKLDGKYAFVLIRFSW